MWLLSYIPDFIVHLLAIVSFMAVMASWMFSAIIPTRAILPLQVIGTLVLALSMYLEGGIANESKWKIKEAEAKQEIAELKQQQAETTVKVVTEYVDRVKIVKEKADVIVKEVPKYITQADNDRCILPDSVRLLHDAAVENKRLPNATSTTDGKAAGSEKTGAK